MEPGHPMLGEKPKVLAGQANLDPDWITTNFKRERTAMWWDRDHKARYDRNYSGILVNIFYLIVLLTELILWVKVVLVWRETQTPGHAVPVTLPLLLPSLCLPLLSVLHSLAAGRLSYSSACLLVPPPAPALLHLIILFRKLKGEDHARLSRAVRAAGLAQALLCSLPLLVTALISMFRATVGEEMVDMTQLHSHLHLHSLQGLAATVSLLNLLVSTLRYNERETGRAVSLLVGFPFLFTNICFRILGFALLFCYFEWAWILLCVGILFGVSSLAVQLSARDSLCSKLFRRLLGEGGAGRPGRPAGPLEGGAGQLLLSLANLLVPCGYTARGRGWRLVLVCWLGAALIHGLVIYQSVISYVPNTYTGLAPVDMNMIIPKTGLAVNIPKMLGGLDVRVVLPRSEMNMVGDHPASYKLSTSPPQDLVMALLIPVVLISLTVPFTILRILLLGWNCALTRQVSEEEEDEEEGEVARRPGKTRNCLTVCCGVSGMMVFTLLIMMVVGIYIFIGIQSVSSPLTKDPSE